MVSDFWFVVKTIYSVSFPIGAYRITFWQLFVFVLFVGILIKLVRGLFE